MDYIELRAEVSTSFVEIIIAELADLGYDVFEETEYGLRTYIEEASFKLSEIEQLAKRYNPEATLTFSWNKEVKQNWNQRWESEYTPIEVEDKVRVRATFHEPSEGFEHELIINPKMSFGTGHHETTWLMMKAQLGLPHEGLAIMDVGCGTGILAVLAKKLGAQSVTAFDIEEWAAENARENFEINGVAENTTIFQGTLANIPKEVMFDGILANINRNVLMEEIPQYVQHLRKNGWLAASGFYEDDRPYIESTALENKLELLGTDTKNLWMTLIFKKTGE